MVKYIHNLENNLNKPPITPPLPISEYRIESVEGAIAGETRYSNLINSGENLGVNVLNHFRQENQIEFNLPIPTAKEIPYQYT
jgi:hypothetical protein